MRAKADLCDPDVATRRWAVTGGAGFIGSHVVELLTRAGGQVTVIDNLSVGSLENVEQALQAGRAEFVQADVRDASALGAALRGADVVVHMAVKCLRISLSDPMSVHDVNATGTLQALRAALACGVRRFLYCSSSEVYGTAEHADEPMSEEHPLDPVTPYGASKAAGELYARSFQRTHGLPVTTVRPFNAYGPRAHAAGAYGEVIPRFVARVLAGLPPVIFGDGMQTRDFTYVEDTARGIVAAALSDAAAGQAINIARGRDVSIVTVARSVANAGGRPDLEPVHEPSRPGDVRRHRAGIDRAERLLGYRASIDLEEGLSRYMAWVRARGVQVAAAEAGRRNW